MDSIRQRRWETSGYPTSWAVFARRPPTPLVSSEHRARKSDVGRAGLEATSGWHQPVADLGGNRADRGILHLIRAAFGDSPLQLLQSRHFYVSQP